MQIFISSILYFHREESRGVANHISLYENKLDFSRKVWGMITSSNFLPSTYLTAKYLLLRITVLGKPKFATNVT